MTMTTFVRIGSDQSVHAQSFNRRRLNRRRTFERQGHTKNHLPMLNYAIAHLLVSIPYLGIGTV